MIETFTLAHLTDVHLSPITFFGPRHWNIKRLLGYLNWLKSRKAVHKTETADALVADALSLRVDHIAVTGDLVNLGLPEEYEKAARWLESAGPADQLTVVPGNHDVYTHLKDHPGVARWASNMGAEPGSLAFPFVRRAGPLAIVGLNSAVETPPFFATGQLGARQIEVAEEMLNQLADEGLIRVVLRHHPPLPGLAPARRALKDAAIFERALRNAGAELVLYGHNHIARLDWLEANAGRVPIIGAASASATRPHKAELLASYNVFTFFQSAAGLRIRYTVRGIERPEGPVMKLSEQVLEIGA